MFSNTDFNSFNIVLSLLVFVSHIVWSRTHWLENSFISELNSAHTGSYSLVQNLGQEGAMGTLVLVEQDPWFTICQSRENNCNCNTLIRGELNQ